MFIGFVLFGLGILLISLRKPIGRRVRSKWTDADIVRVRMAQLSRHGKKQQQFAQRKAELKRELARRDARRTALERELRRLKNVIDDATAGPSLIRVLPGEGKMLFLGRIVNGPVVDAISRGNSPGVYDGCWAVPQTVMVRAKSADAARSQLTTVYSSALGFELQSMRTEDTPLAAIYDYSARFIVPIAVDRGDESRAGRTEEAPAP
ncbi:MAG: hypothetical protein ACK5YI_09810 [Rhodospirillales bacterium]|jgi:hypothetical protein